MKSYRQYIDGKLVEGSSKLIRVTRPADGAVCGEVKGLGKDQAEEALEAAERAFKSWSKLTTDERIGWMEKLGEALRSKREEIIDVLMDETGKVYSGAAYDFDMLFDCLDFFAGAAKGLRGEIIEDGGDEMLNLIIRKPVGVVVGYLAWNFPLLNVAYKLGPVLASGCTAVIKPSSKTPLATLMIGEIMESIGFPAGVVNFVAGSVSEVGPVLSGSTIPSMITMIGSTAGGLQVIKDSATSIKHFSLELGGNAPVIVMDDADMNLAAVETANLKFSNCGQICVAPNRVYAPEGRYDDFLQALKGAAESLKLGWAREEDAYVAPLINRGDRTKMQELVNDAVSKGAKILTGGDIPSDKPEGGNWYNPCVLYDVTPEMRVYKEEIFGPVLPVIKYRDGDDVAALGNDTEYGLAAYLFTTGLDNALKVSRELDFGSVCVNKAFYSAELPHGGLKQSGIGKDCSTYSLDEYYGVQRISIAR